MGVRYETRRRHLSLSPDPHTTPRRDSLLTPVTLAAQIDTGDTAWLLAATALVLLMTPGWPSSTAAWSARRASSTC